MLANLQLFNPNQNNIHCAKNFKGPTPVFCKVEAKQGKVKYAKFFFSFVVWDR